MLKDLSFKRPITASSISRVVKCPGSLYKSMLSQCKFLSFSLFYDLYSLCPIARSLSSLLRRSGGCSCASRRQSRRRRSAPFKPRAFWRLCVRTHTFSRVSALVAERRAIVCLWKCSPLFLEETSTYCWKSLWMCPRRRRRGADHREL